jgi:hypothetical protein
MKALDRRLAALEANVPDRQWDDTLDRLDDADLSRLERILSGLEESGFHADAIERLCDADVDFLLSVITMREELCAG